MVPIDRALKKSVSSIGTIIIFFVKNKLSFMGLFQLNSS